ncbi:MAG TPA: hypothetical protein VH234_03905 [Candidatus Saccharimonadales bacterium]|jgi:hypothetical protein|nr:hypothetical protein [Candidatus Saccharimonadales bacterium]
MTELLERGPTYSPGDIVYDAAGLPTIIHISEDDGMREFAEYPHPPVLLRTQRESGEISERQYLAGLATHMRVLIAYKFGGDLPDGATVRNNQELLHDLTHPH